MCNGGNGMKLLMCNAIKLLRCKKEKFDELCIQIHIDNMFLMEDIRNEMNEIKEELRKKMEPK